MKPVKDLPSTLGERVGGQEYLWCRRCSRTFVLDEAMLDDVSFAKAVSLLEQQSDAGRLSKALAERLHCPHTKCGAPARRCALGTGPRGAPRIPGRARVGPGIPGRLTWTPPTASPSRLPEGYQGFEQGPIRPPSEADSLLIRVTRNCPWNKCTFCPVYKGTRFSRRPVEHVLRDIEAVARQVEIIRSLRTEGGRVRESDLPAADADLQREDLGGRQRRLELVSAPG